MCTTGSRPAYSRTSVNVGETTCWTTPRPAAAPCTKTVLPAPRSPASATTSPGRSASEIARPSSRVSSAELVTTPTEVSTASEQPELLLDRLGRRLAQDGEDRPEVRPQRLELCAGLAPPVQDRRGVKRRHHGPPPDVEALPAHPADRQRPIEDEPGSEVAQRHDHPGIDVA